MGWLFLVVGIVFEVLGTVSMKYAGGFTRLVPSLLVFACYGLSLTALVFVLKTMPVSVAYAIWAGLGTALIAMIGILWFREPLSLVKVVSLLLVIAGIIGLELS